jgi:transposase
MDADFFLQPKISPHKKYEALRASYVDGLSDEDVAEKFGFTYFSFKSIKRDLKQAVDKDFFIQPLPRGKSQSRYQSEEHVIALRKRNYSVDEIKEKLQKEYQLDISSATINDILDKEGFTKLFRRTFRERMEAMQQEQNYAERSSVMEFAKHPGATTPFGGIFLFAPLMMELGLDKLFELPFYGSKQIPAQNYLFSYLCVKLLGCERLYHCSNYNFDYALGGFAGLNVLPKPSTLASFSYRHDTLTIKKLLKGFTKKMYASGWIKGKNINLDFHSIPYFGDTSEIERNWVATRGKRMKSILSLFAQDLDTTFLCYSNGDIRQGEQNDEVLRFIEYYRETTGILPGRLIFDSKLTTYKNLNELDQQGIKFITLGRRGPGFAKKIENVNTWTKIRLDNVKRKYSELECFEKQSHIIDYKGKIREVFVRGNGRELPMRLFTNDNDSNLKQVITYYSHRWRIENNIAENIDFFNLNSLQSPVIVQVNFDIAMTLIANSLYKILSKKIRWFEDATPKTISRKFVNIETQINITDHEFIVQYKKNTYNPMIKDWVTKLGETKISWLGNRKLVFEFL